MRRREFIAGVAGAAVLPWTASAQSGGRRIGILMAPDAQEYVRFFLEALDKLGWVDGRNVHVEYRMANGDVQSLRAAAADLIGLRPEVIFTPGLSLVAARAVTQTIPIVFTQTTAPVERGFVASLGRPGGNVTGFTNFEPSIGSKWLGLLKEVAPKVRRLATIFNPDGAPHAPFLLSYIEAASKALNIATIAAPIRTDAEAESAIVAIARDDDGALVVIGESFTIAHRQTIIQAAAKNRIPSIYSYRIFADDGGLMSYEANIAEQYRGAASYVDRILKGAKPGDLPLQQPNKYEFIINLKTAKALGLTIPETLLATADEVIQ
jgi:putative ABC transport system substrate-binding protein